MHLTTAEMLRAAGIDIEKVKGFSVATINTTTGKEPRKTTVLDVVGHGRTLECAILMAESLGHNPDGVAVDTISIYPRV